MRKVCWWASGCLSPLAFSLHRWLASKLRAAPRKGEQSVSLTLPMYSLDTSSPSQCLLVVAGVTGCSEGPTLSLLGRLLYNPTVEEEETPNGCESGWGCTRLMRPTDGSDRRGQKSQRLWQCMRSHKLYFVPTVDQSEEEKTPTAVKAGEDMVVAHQNRWWRSSALLPSAMGTEVAVESNSRLVGPGTVRAWGESAIAGSISRRLSSFPGLLDLCATPLLKCVRGVYGPNGGTRRRGESFQRLGKLPQWEGKIFGQTWVGQIHQPWQATGLGENSDKNTSPSKSEGTSPHGKEKIVYLRVFWSHGRANDSIDVESSLWIAARIGRRRAPSLKGVHLMLLTATLIYLSPGEDRVGKLMIQNLD